MASDIKEAIRRLIYQYVVEGADKVMATQEAVAASTTKTDKASLSLEKAFGGLERRYVDTVRAQQDYQKVQEKVNAAVAQNPALQERANVVLAAAGDHYNKLATRADKSNLAISFTAKAFTQLVGVAGVMGLAMEGVGMAASYVAEQFVKSRTTVEQALTEQNRLMGEARKLIDEKTSAQDRMFAQSKDVTQFQMLRNELDLRNKLLDIMKQTAISATQRISPGLGEMGGEMAGLAGPQSEGYQKIAEAVQRLSEAHQAGLPGIQAFDNELAKIAAQYPALAGPIDEMIKKTQEQGVAAEQAATKQRAMSDALAGIATNAQMAAAGLGSVAQFNFDNLKAQDAAYALERMANEADRLATIYPNLSYEGAKQVELLDAQLRLAQARTDEEKLTAQELLRQVQLQQQGVEESEAALLAAKERRIAEENITRAAEQQASNQSQVTYAANNTTAAISSAGSAIQQNIEYTTQWVYTVYDAYRAYQHMRYEMGLVEQIANRIDALLPQFGDKQYASTYDPLNINIQKKALEQTYGAGNIEAVTHGVGTNTFTTYQVKEEFFALKDSVDENTAATDALNNTMQNALSPFYSQDPRTTHLGFRAGVVGNPDWMIGGASNDNPLAAVLGPGATAPGMANGGSFVVGGGYSANDNRIAAFPVASGEQVVVNRNRQSGQGGQVVHIDNRIIVTGSVDTDTLAKLKVSKFQQAQRMRAGLAQAS